MKKEKAQHRAQSDEWRITLWRSTVLWFPIPRFRFLWIPICSNSRVAYYSYSSISMEHTEHCQIAIHSSFAGQLCIVPCARCISNIHAVRSIDIPGMVETGFIYAAFLSVALFIMALGHYIITRKLFRGLLSTITSQIHNKYRSSTLFHAIVSSVIGKFLCVFSAIEIIS